MAQISRSGTTDYSTVVPHSVEHTKPYITVIAVTSTLRQAVANAVRDKGVTASNIPEPLTGLGLARLGIRLPIFRGWV